MTKRNAATPALDMLKSKKHFTVLDGLRGIAALGIVVYHFMEWIFTDFTQNLIGHGFLAVDFFFCLSGFVIGYAYDARIRNIGIWDFFKSRLIRLHPLVVLGTILGLIAFVFDPFASYWSLYSTGDLIKIFLCSIFLIPYPVMQERAFNLFSLNAPAWTLFWEYMANIFFALILFRISRYSLYLLAILAAIVLAYVSYTAGNLMGGWDANTFWHGGARILYSFLAGLIIYKANWIIKNKIGFLGLSILLSLALIMPFFSWNWLAELIVVLVYFPLIVCLGAGTTVSPQLNKFCKLSGALSYPLYMTHYSVIWIFGNYYSTNNTDTATLIMIVAIGTSLLVGFAYLVMVLYDTPVRKYLQKIRISHTGESKS